jgi:predicted nucleic acid-binding protein
MTCFFDTNVLIYAIDGRFPDKQRTAISLYAQSVKDRSFVISTQVLIEFYNATTRGKQPLLQHHEAQTQVAALARQHVIPTTASMVVAATAYAQRYEMHWFDALMVQAALSASATTLYSEDMQHGQRFDSLTIVNPFP